MFLKFKRAGGIFPALLNFYEEKPCIREKI